MMSGARPPIITSVRWIDAGAACPEGAAPCVAAWRAAGGDGAQDIAVMRSTRNTATLRPVSIGRPPPPRISHRGPTAEQRLPRRSGQHLRRDLNGSDAFVVRA